MASARLQARRRVDRIAERGVLHPLASGKLPDHDRACADADPDTEALVAE
jgi:hypothetical protein